jgi:hypothetical protein
MKNMGIVFAMAMLGACTDSTRPFDPAEDEVVLAAVSPTSVSVVAGNSVGDVPTVIAHDANGTPRAGVRIAFTVTQGLSSIAGGLGATDASGIAQLSRWTPQPKAGQTTVVTATTGHGNSVTFSASVVAAPPARIVKLEGDNQVGAARSQVSIQPKAMVTDAFGNPLAGVEVRFEVIQGGGRAGPAQTTTDAAGNATLSSWTLGDSGEQLLVASVGSIAQAFHATALESISACVQQLALVPVTALASRFTAESCTQDGRFFAIYYLTLQTPSAWGFEMHSTAFDSYLELRDQKSRLIARNNDSEGSKDSRIRALLPAGTYQLLAFSNSLGVAGNFSLGFGSVSSAPVGCDGLFVVKGDSTAGQLLPLSCNGISLGNTDLYRIHVAAGDSVRVNLVDQSYSGFDIEFLDSDGKTLATGHSTTNYLTYAASYSAESDIDIVVKVSSTDTFAGYTIAFK